MFQSVFVSVVFLVILFLIIPLFAGAVFCVFEDDANVKQIFLNGMIVEFAFFYCVFQLFSDKCESLTLLQYICMLHLFVFFLILVIFLLFFRERCIENCTRAINDMNISRTVLILLCIILSVIGLRMVTKESEQDITLQVVNALIDGDVVHKVNPYTLAIMDKTISNDWYCYLYYAFLSKTSAVDDNIFIRYIVSSLIILLCVIANNSLADSFGFRDKQKKLWFFTLFVVYAVACFSNDKISLKLFTTTWNQLVIYCSVILPYLLGKFLVLMRAGEIGLVLKNSILIIIGTVAGQLFLPKSWYIGGVLILFWVIYTCLRRRNEHEHIL